MNNLQLCFFQLFVFYVFVNGCTHTPKNQKTHPQPSVPSQSNRVDAPNVETSECMPLSQELPFIINSEESIFVVSRFSKNCDLSFGRKGILPQSSWTALGFPCTEGEHKFSYRGRVYAPKTITFPLPIGCEMQDSNTESVQAIVRQTFGLNQEAQQAAHIPFSILFWEWDELQEANLGFEPTIANPDSIGRIWPEYIDKSKEQSLPITIYGQESSWANDRKMLQAKANLTLLPGLKFTLNITQVKPLTEQETKTLLNKCKSLNLSKPCQMLENN